ncbi:MAG: hypothetical protein LQ346_003322 [Caloplaca aetnensis]|nr:MAG: hypothetical protein LQ346_003322 [Caloplaca aetnensis]
MTEHGTNLQAIIDAINSGKIQDAKIVRVISDRAKAFGLQRARDADIPTACHSIKTFREQHPEVKDDNRLRKDYDIALVSLVLEDQPNLVICAGYMRILCPEFLDPLAKAGIPAINLHPALPNAFSGKDAIARAYKEFKDGHISKTGVMVHYVIAEVDAGEPIVIKELIIDKDETCAQLEERMHRLEWLAIVEGTLLAIKTLRPPKCLSRALLLPRALRFWELH